MKILEKTMHSSSSITNSIILDDYIPLKIILSIDDPKTNMYYRLGNGETSLLEICFNGENGEFNNIVFVLLGECKIIDKRLVLDEIKINKSLPAVDVSSFVGNKETETIVDEFFPETRIKLFNNAIVATNKNHDNDIVSYHRHGDVFFAINNEKVITHIIIFVDKRSRKHLLRFCRMVT